MQAAFAAHQLLLFGGAGAERLFLGTGNSADPPPSIPHPLLPPQPALSPRPAAPHLPFRRPDGELPRFPVPRRDAHRRLRRAPCRGVGGGDVGGAPGAERGPTRARRRRGLRAARRGGWWWPGAGAGCTIRPSRPGDS